MKFRFLAPAVLAVAACGETGTATIGPRSFDRPVDVAFGCYGRLKLTATLEETVAPQPLRSCAVRALGSGDPTDRAPVVPGQEGIKNTAMSWFVLAVQPTSGTVTVASTTLKGIADMDDIGNPAVRPPFVAPPYNGADFVIDDADRYIPGHNALAEASSKL